MSQEQPKFVTCGDHQGIRTLEMFKQTYDDFGLDSLSAGRVVDCGIEFQDSVERIIRDLISANRFAGEECRSDCDYPASYCQKPIRQQVALLADMFGLNPDPTFEMIDRISVLKLPLRAEGLFAFPVWQEVGSTYGEAVKRVFTLIATERSFYNHISEELGENLLRQDNKSVRMVEEVRRRQDGCQILVVPAQFGRFHRGRSPRRAREISLENEFCLGTFAVGAMLLSHPVRESNGERLHLSCPGDVHMPGPLCGFLNTPVFVFDNDKLKFASLPSGCADPNFGAASGFLLE